MGKLVLMFLVCLYTLLLVVDGEIIIAKPLVFISLYMQLFFTCNCKLISHCLRDNMLNGIGELHTCKSANVVRSQRTEV